MRALLVALLLAGSSTGQQPYHSTVNTMGGAVNKPVFQFTAPAAGDYATLPVSTGQTPTITRASTKTVMTSSAVLASVASGHFAVDYRGLSIEESRTNLLLQSAAIDSASWTQQHTPTIVANQCTFVDGTATMDSITGADNVSVVLQNKTSPGSGFFTLSGWFSTSTTGPGLDLERSGGSTYSSCTCTIDSGRSCTASGTTDCAAQATASIGSTPARMSVTANSATALTSMFVIVGPGLYNTASNSGATTCAGGIQFEAGAAFATSYIPTTTTAVTRSADVIDLGAVALSSTPSFSVTVNVEGLLSSTTEVLHLTTAGGATSSWQMWINGSGTVACRYDATTDTTTATVTPGVATKLVCKYDGARITTCVAGVCDAGTAMVVSPPSSFSHFYLGNFNGASGFLDGFVSSVCADKRSGGCS